MQDSHVNGRKSLISTGENETRSPAVTSLTKKTGHAAKGSGQACHAQSTDKATENVGHLTGHESQLKDDECSEEGSDELDRMSAGYSDLLQARLEVIERELDIRPRAHRSSEPYERVGTHCIASCANGSQQ